MISNKKDNYAYITPPPDMTVLQAMDYCLTAAIEHDLECLETKIGGFDLVMGIFDLESYKIEPSTFDDKTKRDWFLHEVSQTTAIMLPGLENTALAQKYPFTSNNSKALFSTPHADLTLETTIGYVKDIEQEYCRYLFDTLPKTAQEGDAAALRTCLKEIDRVVLGHLSNVQEYMTPARREAMVSAAECLGILTDTMRNHFNTAGMTRAEIDAQQHDAIVLKAKARGVFVEASKKLQ